MKGTFFAAILGLFSFYALPATAQEQCLPYAAYRQAIEQEGGERLAIVGKTPVYASRGIVRTEVYINPETRSLSYMFVRKDVDGEELLCLGDYLPEFNWANPSDDADPT